MLSRKGYTSDSGADICPIDLALGWGPMSDEEVLDKISISQSDRRYRWYTKKFPIPRKEIETNSANMHLIPATPDIEGRLKSVRKGHLIRIKGYLVSVKRGEWQRKSSLTRSDTGSGSCEIIWVDEFDIL